MADVNDKHSIDGWNILPVARNDKSDNSNASITLPLINDSYFNISTIETPNLLLVVKTLNNNLGKLCSNFNKIHGISKSGNITLITSNTIDKYIKLGAYCIYLQGINEKEDMEGFLITIPMPFIYKNNKDKALYTTSLCVNKNKRQQGLAMMLIKKCVQLSRILGIKVGYQMIPSPIGISPKIINWYRPINYEIAKQHGYELHNFKRPTDRDNWRNVQAYNNKLPNMCSWKNDKEQISYDIYQKLLNSSLADEQNDNIYWNPNIEQWTTWNNFVPIITIYENSEPIGMFSLIMRTCWLSNFNCNSTYGEISWILSNDNMLTHMGKILKVICNYAQYNKCSVIQLYTLINDKEYKQKALDVKFIPSDVNTYFLLYNWSSYPSHFTIPVI